MQAAPQSNDGGEGEDEAPIFAEINVTPLTDVFLVLLIIFMVVSSSMVEAEKQAAKARSLLSERALQVQTPEGSGDSQLVPKDIVVSVLPDGTVFLEGDTFPIEQLDARLAAVQRGATSTRVVVRGDQAAQYRLVWQVINKAQKAGFQDVAISSRASQ
jgi:biopolymer transport protein ExbD